MSEYIYLVIAAVLVLTLLVGDKIIKFREEDPNTHKRRFTKHAKIYLSVISSLVVVSLYLQIQSQKNSDRYNENTDQILQNIADDVESSKITTRELAEAQKQVSEILELQSRDATPEERHRIAALVDDPLIRLAAEHDPETSARFLEVLMSFEKDYAALQGRLESLHLKISQAQANAGRMDPLVYQRTLNELEEEIHQIRLEVSYFPSTTATGSIRKSVDSATNSLIGLRQAGRLVNLGVRASGTFAVTGDVGNTYGIEGTVEGMPLDHHLWVAAIDDKKGIIRPASQADVRNDWTWSASMMYFENWKSEDGKVHIGIFLVDGENHKAMQESQKPNGLYAEMNGTETVLLLDRFVVGRTISTEGEDVFMITTHELVRQ